jgi:4-hydroxy-tetrahydrodipicolinate synthase
MSIQASSGLLHSTKVWTALVSPMRTDGSLDLDRLCDLASRQQDAGNGIVLLGSTGEALALDSSEKRMVVEAVAGMGLTVPVMAGVAGFNLNEQLAWMEVAAGKGIDAFMMVVPIYSKPGPVGQLKWFQRLMDASPLPCMLYNIPSRAGVPIHPSVLAALEHHPNMMGVKEAAGTIESFHAYRMAAPSARLYSGDDGFTPYYAAAGAVGLVSVVSNAWPELTRRITELSLSGAGGAGGETGAPSEWNRIVVEWTEICKTFFMAANPIPAKRLLLEKGLIGSAAVRLPLSVDEMDATRLSALLDADRRADELLERANMLLGSH